jgi:hypothetical protein
MKELQWLKLYGKLYKRLRPSLTNPLFDGACIIILEQLKSSADRVGGGPEMILRSSG